MSSQPKPPTQPTAQERLQRPNKGSRSMTFRIPEELYERLERVAYDELASESPGATPGDLNDSEYLRRLIALYVATYESEHRGGPEALRTNFHRAQTAELERKLQEMLANG